MVTASYRRFRHLSVSVLSLLAHAVVCQATDSLPPAAQRKVSFETDVEPILKQRCYVCHGPRQQTSGLKLDDRESALKGGNSGAVVKPGDSAGSQLILRVAGAKDLMRMPPGGAALTPQQIGILRAWIDQGVSYPAHAVAARPVAGQASGFWAFQPVRKPETPPVMNGAWVFNPIDAFILARLELERIQPSPGANRATLLRRLSLDLIGLPPTVEDIEAFVSDNRPDAYERVVDRLLQSPHYGEKWARFWLDQARYGDSDGYEKDWVRPNAWRYREWVIRALNEDMPFDRFTIEQNAGDLLPNATVDDKVAAGFHRNTLTNREGGVDNEQFRFENVVDRASTVGTVWLGLTVGCAQCHDHKFDPIKQSDFYRFAAFFDNLDEVEIDAPMPGEIGPWMRTHAEYREKREAILQEYHVAELQAGWEAKMLEAAATPGKHTDWDLAWDVLLKLCAGGDCEAIIRTRPEQRTTRQREVLTDHFVKNYHFAVGEAKIKEVNFKELEAKLESLKATYPQLTQASTVAESSKQRKSYIRIRGNYKALGIEVHPGLPEIFGVPQSDHMTRLDLARWLVSPRNPLTARVIVNRFWQELFGQGIVKTSDDFGTQGDKPSHPELLDWLAAKFVEDGWSMKRIQKLMVMSATYRQSSEVRPDLQARDPNNILLARQSRLRLPAEIIRDEALASSGLLSPKIGGPSVRPPQPKGVAELAYANSVKWAESKGEDRYRRGLYIHFQRTTPYPLLANFDAARGNVSVCRRLRSNTPLQALNLLNDPVFLEAAQALAYRVSNAASFEDRLSHAFRLALGRGPETREVERLKKFFDQQKVIFDKDPQAAAALVPVAGTDRTSDAAWVTLSSILLNLDEFITRE